MNLVKVSLRYPSVVISRPDRAKAEALARETKTLWIVRREDVTITENPGNIRFGYSEMRFNKRNGRKVGASVFQNGWCCNGPREKDT